jgi:hypothetical protein
MDTVRRSALLSAAKVRLVLGTPGTGKTYLGCEIAEYELNSPERGVGPHQKVLFLTFARNAVARIRQAFLERAMADKTEDAAREQPRGSKFLDRVRLDTFAGFFWWLVGSYGRYVRPAASLRPWLIGSVRIGHESISAGGFSFEMHGGRDS